MNILDLANRKKAELIQTKVRLDERVDDTDEVLRNVDVDGKVDMVDGYALRSPRCRTAVLKSQQDLDFLRRQDLDFFRFKLQHNTTPFDKPERIER